MGVKTGGDDDKLWFELIYLRQYFLHESRFIVPVVVAGGHGAIQGGAFASANAGFPVGASAGVKGVLMGADVQHRGVLFKGMLGAVAMMHIPIEDQRLVNAVSRLQVARHDGHIVKQAKSHGLVVLGVVSGGTRQGEAIVQIAVDHSVRQGDGRAHRLQRGVV